MKQKIKVALKQKYSHTGLGDDVMDGVAAILAGNVTEETQIDTAVAGCEPLLKVVQGSLDKERNARSEAEKRVKELAEKQKAEPKTKEDESKKDEPMGELSELKATIEALSSKLEGLTRENTQKTKLEQLTALLTEKKVPESYYRCILDGRTFGEDFKVDEYATAVSNGWADFQREMADERFKGVQPPDKGAGVPDKDDDPLAKMISEGTKSITENSK